MLLANPKSSTNNKRESILKKMKRLGIIQAYIKEFEEVTGQMQFDLFHVYTVDEHTFKVVRNMRQMKINHID